MKTLVILTLLLATLAFGQQDDGGFDGFGGASDGPGFAGSDDFQGGSEEFGGFGGEGTQFAGSEGFLSGSDSFGNSGEGTAQEADFAFNRRKRASSSFVEYEPIMEASEFVPYTLVRVRRGMMAKKAAAPAPPPAVGPVHTHVKTDYHGNFQWGVKHMVGS